jgi:hypothetical protein
MSQTRQWLTSLLLGSVIAAPAHAGKVKVWHHASAAAHERAHLEEAIVSNQGALRLARRLKPLADLDASHVWDVIEDGTGSLLVATGGEGKVYRIGADGRATVALETDDAQVLCLARAPDGAVYAGTGPRGKVFRLPASGPGELVCHIPDAYVWCLAVNPATQAVFAGTGPDGRVYVLTAGEPKLFYATRQEHVLSLAFGSQENLFAGTDRNGLVYRIDRGGKGFVLYHAPQSEVRRLLPARDGVYAATSAPRRRDLGGRVGGERFPSPSSPAILTSAAKTADRASTGEGVGAPAASPGSKGEEKKGNAAPAPPPPLAGENSVYHIAPDGTAREVFREKALVLSLLRQGRRLLVGTGMEGQLFEVDEDSGEKAEIARLDHGEVHCLYRRRDGGIIVGAGDPGRLYLLEDRYVERGTVVSEVLDAKLPSRWGSLRWKADLPPGTAVTVAVRSGNLPDPDETWSDWSAEQSDAESATADSPPARYLQYRLTLRTEEAESSPAVHSVSVRYRPANLSPEVTAVEVPDLDGSNADNPKRLKLKWSATDPNEDELTYRLYVRKDGWSRWVQIADELEKREYEWDTTTAPPGTYRLKVVASDRRDNPAEEARTGERVSATFVVAHAAPEVTLNVREINTGRAVIEATASDPLVRLTAAAYAVDGQAWVNAFPADGLFDRPTARFRITTDALKPGTHVFVLRVRDAAGNMGAGDVLFTVPE